MTKRNAPAALTYTVTTICDGKLGGDVIGRDMPRSKAFTAAKKAAGKGASFTAHYGPSSCAYVGTDVTAVIAW